MTAYRWLRCGLLLVPARKVGRLILVDDPKAETVARGCTAVYARVSSADQKADLHRQVVRVTAWATAEQIPVDKVVTEVGSALKCLTANDTPGVGMWSLERVTGMP